MTTALARPDRFARRVYRNRDTVQVVRSGRADLTDLPTIGPITINALPQTANLLLYQGDTVFLFLTVWDTDGQPVPGLEEDTVLSQIRTAPADTDPVVLAQFESSITGNQIALYLSHTVSTNLHGGLVWDCQLTDPNGWVTTLTAGTVTITPEVTR